MNLVAIFCPIGFSIELPVRLLYMFKPKVFVCVSSEKRDDRVERTVGVVKQVVAALGVRFERYDIPEVDMYESVSILADILSKYAGRGNVAIVVGSGLRILLAELILSALNLTRDQQKNIILILAREPSEVLGTVYMCDLIYKQPVQALKPEEERLLQILKTGKVMEFGKIVAATRWPKPTLFKRLQRLERMGYIKRVRKGLYVITERGERYIEYFQQ
ncbi:MAG: hypothetical protein DRJ59_03490 [Thermoprotei archaeon]|nr:MAG: hypothetical protein DRJ59_03490 [Thermoprotei archaeon]